MTQLNKDINVLSVGVFYDGNYLSHVSNYYTYHHARKSRLSVSGLHEFIRQEVATLEHASYRMVQIVDAHYFRGRMGARKAMEQNSDQLFKDRQWDDVLIREGVTMHFLPLSTSRYGDFEEKGVDVKFALEAYELTMHKRFDVVVLVTGDGDFVPLVKKINTLGSRVMLLGWDFEYEFEGQTRGTKTNQSLINECTYPIMMNDVVDGGNLRNDFDISKIFVCKREEVVEIVEPVSDLLLPKSGDRDNELLFGSIVTIEKVYAFIKPDLGGDNVFFHGSSIIKGSLSELQKDMRVSYLEKKTDRGIVGYDVSLESD